MLMESKIDEKPKIVFYEEDKVYKVLELKDRNNKNEEESLPVVAIGANIRVKEQFVQLELHYVFLNNGETREVDLEVHKIDGTYSGEVRVFKIPPQSSSSNILTIKQSHEDEAYQISSGHLSKFYSKIGLNGEFTANHLWRVTYTHYWPVTCSENDGKNFSFTLPKEVYQVTYDATTYQSFADKLSDIKFEKLNEFLFLAPYELKVNEIYSKTDMIENVQITSRHTGVDLSTKGCSAVNSTNNRRYEDFSFQWQNELPSPDEPLSVLEYDDGDSNYYLYLKAFPKAYIKDVLEDLCENLNKELTPNRKYLFTIVLDTGSSVLQIENQKKVKQAAKTILDKLMSFPDQEQIEFRIVIAGKDNRDVKDDKDEIESPAFKSLNKENLEATKKEIAGSFFSEYNTDFSKSLKSFKEQFSEDENEEHAHRYIFISTATTNKKGLITDMSDLIKKNGQIRFYYVSVEPKIDFDLQYEMMQKGTGLAVCFKDEVDLDNKMLSIVTHALKPYNYKIEVSFEGFVIEPVSMNYVIKTRGAYESMEFLGRFSSMNNNKYKVPSQICVSINFNSCEGAQLNFKKNIQINKDVNKYFISEIYNDIENFESREEVTNLAGAGCVRSENGKVFYEYAIYYGEEKIILKFPSSNIIESVKTEIISKLNLKNVEDKVWILNKIYPEDSQKTLAEKFKEIEYNITIPVPESPKVEFVLHKELVKKIGKNGLFAFDVNFMIDTMGVKKAYWIDFEKKILTKEICNKLFNIKIGIDKNNREIVFSYYCLFYINAYLKDYVSVVEKELDKVKKGLKILVEDYSEDFQKKFDKLVNFTPAMFK